MSESVVWLRATTLVVLLTTTGGYSFLPHARPLIRPVRGHQLCNSATPRTRLAPFCAIAVGRGTSLDEQEGTTPGKRRVGSNTPGSQHGMDRAAAAAEIGRGQWYGIQEIQEQRERGISVVPTAQQSGGGVGLGANKELQGRATGAAATIPRSSFLSADKKGKGGKAGKGSKGSKGAKAKTNPTIGKTNLDTIIGDSAKLGVIPGVFGGDAERAQAAAAAAARAEALAKAAAEVEEEDEDDDARLTWTARWRRRVTFVTRTVQIWAFLFHVLIKLLRQKLVQRDEERMSARRRKLGRYLCKAFLKLGPTFIKIGQLLSTRVDLLSTEYIEELQQLQDNVPGFGGVKAISIIEKELGAPISELFDSFNSTSLAAASLGQVHEAWLDGKRYAVKVQRPGLKRLFEVDLNSIGALAGVLDRYDPKLDGASRDWGAIFRESSRVLYEEVDYTREGKNAERFSENFKGTEWIKAPGINWSRSTSKVLCMEFVEGIKINDVAAIERAGVDRAVLATRTAECYLEQLIRHGFFHCDPHPGNLACDAVAGGRIIFYDFGMMDELTRPLKRSFSNLIFGIYGNDVKEVVDSLEEMDVIRKGADRMTVERVTRFYLGEFQTTLTKGGKYINQLDPEEEKALIRRERAQIGQDLFSGQAAVPLQFPASFTFVFRAFTTLDGIGKTLDKGYDLTRIAGPYLKELLDLKDGNAYVSVLKGWQKKLGWRGQDVASVVQSPRRVQHVENVVSKLETGDLKLRVRVLESEAAFARIEAVQGSLSSAVMATLLLNAGVLMAGRAAVTAQITSRAMFVLAGFFGLKIPVGYLKVWQLNRQATASKGFR